MEMLPSRTQVLYALKALRSRKGLSAQRVEDEDAGHLLGQLPAVAHEMSRRGFSEDSWPLAVVAVIECGIERLIDDPQQKVALRFVLNFAGGGSSADGRRELARAHLYLTSEKRFAEIEQAAFINLADRLLLAETSPCLVPPPHPFGTFTPEDQREAQEWLAAAPRALLALLGATSSPVARSRLAAALLNHMPKGRAVLERHDQLHDDPVDQLRALFLQPGSRGYYLVLCDRGSNWLRRRRGLRWLMKYQPLLEDLILELLVEPGAGTIERLREVAKVHAESHAMLEPDDDPDVFVDGDGLPTAFFHRLLNRSLDLAWQSLLDAEAHEWAWLEDGLAAEADDRQRKSRGDGA
ncbi:MAG: hypothetical protein QM655_11615 [Nocardioidaceae bacterium]